MLNTIKLCIIKQRYKLKVKVMKEREHTDISTHASTGICSDHDTFLEDKSKCGCSFRWLHHLYSLFLKPIELKPHTPKIQIQNPKSITHTHTHTALADEIQKEV